MKRLLVVLSLGLLAGCLDAGNFNIMPARNDVFIVAQGYKITFYAKEPVLIKTELIEETNFKFNVAETIYKGYSVITSKTYRKDVYAEDYVKANKKGLLSSPSLGFSIDANKKYRVIGQVDIDGVTYRLIPDAVEGFAFLFDNQGRFYDKCGKIDGDYLTLLESEFFPRPKDIRMLDINTNKGVQTKPTAGFDVKYDGIRLNRIWFTYLDYATGGGDYGNFENISFPNKPGLITINGVKMRVLQADTDKITYMLLK